MKTRVLAGSLLVALACFGQLWKMTPEELAALTAKSTFERYPDGRPKTPDALLDRLRTMNIAIEDMTGRP